MSIFFFPPLLTLTFLLHRWVDQDTVFLQGFFVCSNATYNMQLHILHTVAQWASQMALEVKNLPASVGGLKRCGFESWVGKILWRRAWQPTLVFILGEFLWQRSLAGYGPWGCKELGTNWSNLGHTHTHTEFPNK